MDLEIEKQDTLRDLTIMLNKLRKSGTDYAEKEKKYKILLREECLKLRDSGMAIGMIDKICYGIPVVAEARFERDVAETMHKVNFEEVNSIKLQLRLLDAQIEREYGINNSN